VCLCVCIVLCVFVFVCVCVCLCVREKKLSKEVTLVLVVVSCASESHKHTFSICVPMSIVGVPLCRLSHANTHCLSVFQCLLWECPCAGSLIVTHAAAHDTHTHTCGCVCVCVVFVCVCERNGERERQRQFLSLSLSLSLSFSPSTRREGKREGCREGQRLQMHANILSDIDACVYSIHEYLPHKCVDKARFNSWQPEFVLHNVPTQCTSP